MKYIDIGEDMLKVSKIGYGTASIGVNQTQFESNRLLFKYVKAGGNYIDTASVYSDWIEGEKSRSEKTIGRCLKDNKIRNRIYIGTKGAHPLLVPNAKSRVTKKDIVFDLESSLKNLNTDYIDMYWLHRDDETKDIEEILYILESLKKEGKINCYGCSNFSLKRIKEASEVAKRKSYKGFVANQIEWSATKVNIENKADKTMKTMDKETLDYHMESEMAVFSYATQAKGYYDVLNTVGYDDLNINLKNKYHNPNNDGVFRLLKEYSNQTSYTLTQLAIAYLHQKEKSFPLVTLIGTSNLDRLKMMMETCEILLKESLVNEIDKFLI